jgi:hypothetical protein
MTTRPAALDAVPHAEQDGDGRGDWHNDTEMRRLVRPMTAEEYADHIGYDRSAFRTRERIRLHELAVRR